jgi:molybdenum cofactor cytidylyltransferase
MTGSVAAIVLAAGSSRRMGPANKLLTHWRGRSLVRHVARTAVNSLAVETIVVTGHESEVVARELDGLKIRIVDNPHFADGLSSSLATGINALAEAQAGAVILLADMPMLHIDTLNKLIEAFEETKGMSICVPVCGGRRGNPVVWPSQFFPEILQLSGDRGARDLLKTHKDRVREVNFIDSGVLIDIDSPDDMDINLSRIQD